MALVEVVKGEQTSDETVGDGPRLRRGRGQDADHHHRLARLRREPHPLPDDQRGRARLRGGRGQRRGHRHGHEARAPTGRWGRWRWPTWCGMDTTSAILETLERELGDAKYQPRPRSCTSSWSRARWGASPAPASTTTGSDGTRERRPQGVRPGLHRGRQGQDHGVAGARPARSGAGAAAGRAAVHEGRPHLGRDRDAAAAARCRSCSAAWTTGCTQGKVTAEDRAAAAEGLARGRALVESGDYDLVVLDELCTALYFELVGSTTCSRCWRRGRRPWSWW